MTLPISRRDVLLATAAGALSLESLAPGMTAEPTEQSCDAPGPFLVKPYVQFSRIRLPYEFHLQLSQLFPPCCIQNLLSSELAALWVCCLACQYSLSICLPLCT